MKQDARLRPFLLESSRIQDRLVKTSQHIVSHQPTYGQYCCGPNFWGLPGLLALFEIWKAKFCHSMAVSYCSAIALTPSANIFPSPIHRQLPRLLKTNCDPKRFQLACACIMSTQLEWQAGTWHKPLGSPSLFWQQICHGSQWMCTQLLRFIYGIIKMFAYAWLRILFEDSYYPVANTCVSFSHAGGKYPATVDLPSQLSSFITIALGCISSS